MEIFRWLVWQNPWLHHSYQPCKAEQESHIHEKGANWVCINQMFCFIAYLSIFKGLKLGINCDIYVSKWIIKTVWKMLSRNLSNLLWNNRQMQLYAVNFIPLLGSLYMFRAFYTPIIRSTIFNCIYSHWYKPQYRLSYLLPAWPAGQYFTLMVPCIIIYSMK